MHNVSLTIPESIARMLDQVLTVPAPDEGAAVVLCSHYEGDGRLTLLGRNLIIPRPADFAMQDPGGVGYTTSFLRRILNIARRGDADILFAHSHPFADGSVYFSSIDDAWDHQLGSFMTRRMPGIRYASLVRGRSSWQGRLYDKETDDWIPIRGIKVVGQHLDWIPQDSDPEPPSADIDVSSRYSRQMPLVGKSGQDKIQRSCIAVGGLGGIGCHVALQLAYLGVHRLILIDPDWVEPSNLNRLIGATPADASIETPKIEVARREIARLNPDVQVHVVQRNIQDCAPELKQADMIILGVDCQVPRYFCSRFAAQFYIPVLDVATGITQPHDELTEIYGQMRLLLPDGPCLECMGGIDHQALRQEMMTEEERSVERRHGYGLGPAEPAPAVVSLNGTLASLAVTECLNLVCGMRPPIPYLFYNGSSIERPFEVIAVKKREDCPICGLDALGIGDRKSIPDLKPTRPKIPSFKEDQEDDQAAPGSSDSSQSND